MSKLINKFTRRSFLATGSVGAVSTLAMSHGVSAQQATPEESQNIEIVNSFCAAFAVPWDWEKITSFLTSDCKYRASQDVPMVEGPDGVVGLLEGFLGDAASAEFEGLDTWARGPVVVDDRVDRFVLPDNTLDIRVVGIFYLTDGKIAEWTDFTFDSQQ